MKLLLVSIAVATSLTLLGRGLTKDPQVPAKLVPQSRTLDFGEVWEQPEFRWEIQVVNPSTRSIAVKELKTGCTCVQVNPRSFVVPPGETQVIDVVLDLRDNGVQLSAGNSTQNHSSYSAAITPIYTDRKSKPQDAWYITGKIRHPFVGLQRVWNIGTVPYEGFSKLSADMPVVCADGVSLVDASCDDTWGTAQASFDAPNTPNVILRLQRHKLGRFEFPLQLQASTEEGLLLPPVFVTVTGSMVGDVEVYPAESALGLLRKGQDSKSTILIRSRSGQQLKAEKIVCSNDHIEILSLSNRETIPDGALTYSVKVTSALPPGNYSEVINFEVLTKDRKVAKVSHRLTYVVSESEI